MGYQDQTPPQESQQPQTPPPQGTYPPPPPPPQQYQPQGGYPPPQPPQNDPNRGKSIAAMVLGIIAIVITWFGYASIVAIILAIVSLALSVPIRKVTVKGDPNYGMATAGFVLSVISLILACIGLITFIACTVCVGLAGLY